jgi:SAM-dependent methyltransferase
MARCPVCNDELRRFLELGAAPVYCNVLHPTAEAAVAAPTGRIELALCHTCGLIRNVAFDPELVRYSPEYENSLHFSPAFNAWAEALARRLVERYGLRGCEVVDIGCGKGDFLKMLCAGTGNRGRGYDPSYEGPAVRVNGSRLTFVRELFGREHAREPADLISCRHVLEHLDAPGELLATLAGSDAMLYFEMPDGDYLLRGLAAWDVIYEHVSHFTAPALQRLFTAYGFGALEVGTTFGGQYLYIEASRDVVSRDPEPVGDLPVLAAAFADAYEAKLRTWSRRLTELRRRGQAAALWGAGSKGVTFLNAVDGGAGVVQVVDVNERKHGRHVPGTGQEVIGPEALAASPPDVLLVMNPLYVGEIRGRLQAIGVDPEVVLV